MASKLGEWSFIVGVLLSILFGFIPIEWDGLATLALVVLGLVVGLLNITEKESTPFLVAAVALMTVTTVGANLNKIPPVVLGTFLQSAVGKIGVFVAPAAVVVGLKAIRSLAQD